MLLEVKSAKYVGGYKVFVSFNNGYTAIIDLEDTIKNKTHPIFQPLQDQAYFKTFSVKLNTICWKNEADFAPEFLYSLAKHQSKDATSMVQQAAYGIIQKLYNHLLWNSNE